MVPLIYEENLNYCYFPSSLLGVGNFSKYLIAVYQQYGAEKAWEIYTQWYNKGKFLQEHFFDNLHLNMDSANIELEFKRHEQWRNSTKLNATPTILVNGYKIPYGYKIEDMQYIT